MFVELKYAKFCILLGIEGLRELSIKEDHYYVTQTIVVHIQLV